jgi:hypothetical protein
MLSGNRPGLAGDGSDEPRHGFHDLLLSNRSKAALSSRRRTLLARLMNRKTWIGWEFRLFRLVGDGGILLGGAALGVGAFRLYKGESLGGRPGIIIAAGLCFVILTILARLLVRSRSSLKAQQTAGQ